MSNRVTIMIDEDLDEKIRNKQADVIKKTHSTYSYSRCLNDHLRKVLK